MKQTKILESHFHYIADVLSLNNPKFNDYIDVIYPKKLKDTTEAPRLANYLNLRLEFNEDAKLFTRNVMTLISL